MSLRSFLFFILEFLVSLLDLLLDFFLALLDQGLLQPLFELHVADFLLLLLFKPFLLILLHIDEFLVLDVPFLLIDPLISLVESLLHS